MNGLAPHCGTPQQNRKDAADSIARPKSGPNGHDPFRSQIIHGECQTVLRSMPDETFGLVLTDPPYVTRYEDRHGRRVANDDNTRWMFPAFAEIYRVLQPDRYCVSFYGWSRADRFLQVWRECGFKPIGHFVWVKSYASRVRHTRMKHEQAYLLAKGDPLPPEDPPSDVLEWKYTGNEFHPTQKPVESLIPLIAAYSRPHEIVLDPFAGSGSTGVAAERLGRRSLLIEKDAGYHAVMLRRFSRRVK